MATLSFSLYTSAAALPEDWDVISSTNIFLSRNYLAILEKAAPENMQCHFIGLFKEGALCGVALAQYINLQNVNTFAEKRRFSVKDFVLRKFSSNVIMIGNNSLTGQNAHLLNDLISEKEALQLVRQALQALSKQYRKRCIFINLLAIKDFNEAEMPDFKAAGYRGYYKFFSQPNMIVDIRENWHSIDDYLGDLNTKYRTQYNRARKKSEDIDKRRLFLDEIKLHQERIHQLYMTVAQNASFTTFYLPKNHFEIFKEQIKDDFLFYGYFLNDTLVGFSTVIKNSDDIDTYFLGYDDSIQKEKMLYLNMLYDMVAYGIKKRFKHVILARSAMEIKSSIGAKAEEVYGLIKHTNPLLNLFMGRLFHYVDPKIEWTARSPFK